MAGRESWVASWIFSQSNVNSTKTEITGLEGHYNPAATTNVSSNLTTRFLFSSPLSPPAIPPRGETDRPTAVLFSRLSFHVIVTNLSGKSGERESERSFLDNSFESFPFELKKKNYFDPLLRMQNCEIREFRSTKFRPRAKRS